MQRPDVGTPVVLEDGLRVVLAPNHGPMTHWGTNTFILGEGRVAIIDPGPESDDHFQSLLDATKGETVTHVLVTHAHMDHSPLARRLSQATDAPVLAFGTADAGRSPVMARLAKEGLAGGGEGVDEAFRPDIKLDDGDVVQGEGWALNVLHTPGHFAGHLSFAFESRIISGDHVMDWASSLVSPPDGDVAAFMATSERLLNCQAKRLYPAHGAPIDAVEERLIWLIEHRRSREEAILEQLGRQWASLLDITQQVYTDIAPEMLIAASRNVFAHLIDLVERNLAEASPELSTNAGFRRR